MMLLKLKIYSLLLNNSLALFVPLLTFSRRINCTQMSQAPLHTDTVKVIVVVVDRKDTVVDMIVDIKNISSRGGERDG